MLQTRGNATFFRLQQVIFALQFEVAAEVQAFYLIIGGQFFGGAVLKYFSFDQKIGAVANGKGFGYVVVGDENADVLVLEPCHDALNIFHRDGVNAGKGFIKQHNRFIT